MCALLSDDFVCPLQGSGARQGSPGGGSVHSQNFLELHHFVKLLRHRRLDSSGNFRFSFLMTSFRPDQTSSTAQTLMSTSPSGSATSLMVSSVMSVGTFDDFLGHDTQIIPFGLIFSRHV